MDLSVCKDIKVSIKAPVKLDNNTSLLYDDLRKSGYNLFDEEDLFYTDICSIYTSENGTDILLEDRKKEIFSKNGNISLCQSGCELVNYNSSQEKAECQCLSQNEKKEMISVYSDNQFNMRNISDVFFKSLKNSNFLVMRCYKLAFNFTNFIKNIGRFFMSIILVFQLIIFIIFCFIDFKNINKYLVSILNIKMNYIGNFKKKSSTKRKSIKSKKDSIKENVINNNNTINNNNIEENKINFPPKRRSFASLKRSDSLFRKNERNVSIKSLLSEEKYAIQKINNNEENKDNKENKQNKENKENKNININFIPINNINYRPKNNINNEIQVKRITKKKTTKKLIKKSKTYNKIFPNKKGKSEKTNSKKDFIYKNLNDQELNTLEYKLAIKIDKRTYLLYYWSLLKRKNLILFTFYPNDDYNLITLKISLFLTSFSLYMTINGFFFTDDTMHTIYSNNGSYNLMYQIPKIMYSFLVSSVINIILRQLSLSESNLIDIKREKKIKKVKEDSKNVIKYLKLRFLIFFVVSYLLLFFFWYFITCFCGVYTNTQIILIEDSLISFGVSMLSPFGLCLFPGFFRIQALKAPKKDKNLMYQISLYSALLI